MKKDAYYFSHDANSQDDPKCMLLIDQLGMEGYGIFWALVEKLRSESNYRLPISVCSAFARRWSTSKEKIETVIMKFGLFIIENDEFFSLRLMRSMQEKSDKARLSAHARWNNNKELENKCDDADAMRTHADAMQNDAIKGKERKEKGKEKENKEKENINKQSKYQFVLDLWNNTCINLQKVLKSTNLRDSHISQRIKNKIDFNILFEKISKSDFLNNSNGTNKDGWKATFDWVIQSENNCLKILEGNYDNKQQSDFKLPF